jgi:hypothetical protein
MEKLNLSQVFAPGSLVIGGFPACSEHPEPPASNSK